MCIATWVLTPVLPGAHVAEISLQCPGPLAGGEPLPILPLFAPLANAAVVARKARAIVEPSAQGLLGGVGHLLGGLRTAIGRLVDVLDVRVALEVVDLLLEEAQVLEEAPLLVEHVLHAFNMFG